MRQKSGDMEFFRREILNLNRNLKMYPGLIKWEIFNLGKIFLVFLWILEVENIFTSVL